MSFIPVTPGGSLCIHLASKTEEEAWERLIEDAAHMPYRIKENFVKRGYTVEKYPTIDAIPTRKTKPKKKRK